jgi:hypothetical protein
MAKYKVNVFTPRTVNTEYPENSYYVNTTKDVADIISNCTRKVAGIRMVQVWIDEPDDREAINTKNFLEAD